MNNISVKPCYHLLGFLCFRVFIW